MPYTDSYLLSADLDFLHRVEMAMLDYCNDVQKEADTVAGHNLRKAAAAKALNDPPARAQLVAKTVCAAYPQVTSSITDPQLKQQIALVWISCPVSEPPTNEDLLVIEVMVVYDSLRAAMGERSPIRELGIAGHVLVAATNIVAIAHDDARVTSLEPLISSPGVPTG